MAPGATENGVEALEALVTALTAPSKESNGTENVPDVGMECDIKNLYQKEDARGRTTWTDKYPDNLDEAAENEITARFAILVRNKKSFDSRKKLEIDSIVVQSPLLKKVLSKVLKDYPGVTTNLKRLIFQAPFNPFVHRWTQFTAALEEQEEGETKSHLQLLHTTLEAELKDTIEAKNDFVKNKVITFGYLWTIFQPGATIYTKEWDRHCGSKFSQGSYYDHPKYGPVYGLNCQKVDWDGDKFGYANCHHVVTSFAGTMSISALDAIPLEFHPEQKKIRAQLLKRGKLFEHYHGYHYKSYKSFAIGKNMCGQDIKVTIDSRIIIDTHAYGKFNPNSVGHLQALKMKSKADTPEDSDEEDNDSEYDDDDDDDEEEEEYDDDYDQQNHRSTHNAAATGTDTKLIALSEDHLLHCSSLLKGYALKTKRWLSFFVDEISEIVWNNAAFSNLVLPADQKELILAFAESQVKYKDSFDDVISGKGKGIIMLLSGGPGIGKTLTAESVAENMQVPLYMMSAGDLGIKSSEVESSLTTILEMVAKWNAVLLLDECDVFLEARSAHDLERNKIVSIFLRTLEYYEGILFLTTNRVKNMDPAFQSRIHISMEYPGLDKSARVKVWRNFLERGVKHELSEGELDRLAGVEINGRQIKNVLKTSQLLSQHKGVPLRYEHLRTVLNVERKELELA
ncbi:Fidgetin-like protein 1 [Lachnellula cervina]|uniref:Fidgetin-like protein 1 n=1 Tax=Lachnellula cervina TaxID=1316786 RepID=A0A7D8Z7G9_9HELO|nr:Fidgetin-like protein 1 [Lachnellula cervina]